MATQQVNSQIQITQQTQTVPVYENCLLVTRHKLLQMQEQDLLKLCKKIVKLETLPTDINELRKVVEPYSAVVGVIPLPLQVQLIQLKKTVLLFEMESAGTVKTRQEAEQLLANLAKDGREGVILPPSKEGEPYRISIYRGVLRVKNIIVDDERIIQH